MEKEKITNENLMSDLKDTIKPITNAIGLKPTFGERLKEIRTEKKLTQAELATKVDISSASIISYEKSQKLPSLEVAVMLATKLDVSIDWLSGLSDNRDSNKNINSIRNLNDLLQTIIDITECINSTTIDIEEDYNPSIEDLERVVNIRFNDSDIVKFVNSWIKMRNLYKDGTIDNTIYTTWLNGEIKKYENVSIKDGDSDAMTLEEWDRILASEKTPF